MKSNRSNERRIFRDLDDVEGGWDRSIRETWFELADDLKGRANAEILRKPKSGRIYIRRDRLGRRRRHRASAPGETHANDTGALRKAIGWKVHGNNEMIFGYGVTRNSPDYDEFVEFGTRRMAARPSLANAIDYTQANPQQHFSNRMTQEFGT